MNLRLNIEGRDYEALQILNYFGRILTQTIS